MSLSPPGPSRRGSKIGIETLRNDEGVVPRDTLHVDESTGELKSFHALQRRGSTVSIAGVTIGGDGTGNGWLRRGSKTLDVPTTL